MLYLCDIYGNLHSLVTVTAMCLVLAFLFFITPTLLDGEPVTKRAIWVAVAAVVFTHVAAFTPSKQFLCGAM